MVWLGTVESLGVSESEERAMYDLVIRNGTIIDGTGAPPYIGDIAANDGRIVQAGGTVADGAREEFDAAGLIVTPGFVDVHTHYDGQASWDETLAPSSLHGVTTVVMGNCGVGFAPVRPDRHEYLVQLMEGVEDIPGTALHEGISWEWETFPQYLDALDRKPRSLDVACQVPHGALRTYVMGDSGADEGPASTYELAEMAALVEESIRAGAVGLSTNRLAAHTAKDGRPVPGTFADELELDALAGAMAGGGGGVLELVSSEGMGMVDGGYHADVDLAARLSARHGIPVSVCLSQVDNKPDLWRDVLGWIAEHRAAGADVSAQVAGRPLGILLGLTTKHVFEGYAAYEEVAHLPLAERVIALAEPERRRRILAQPQLRHGLSSYAFRMADKAFPMGDVPDYEPDPSTSVAAIASASGRSIEDVFYDNLLERDGRQFVLFTLGGYANRNLDHVREMIAHPDTVVGLADGGAHVALICDASVYTSLLSYFVHERTRGPRLPLEVAVAKMTRRPAALYGFDDRGAIKPGMKADVNLIDTDRLALHLPEVYYDLPTGAPRVMQKADGYVATMVSGVVTRRDGEDTGARPGRLIRSGH
jgi:N-acyl-D-aspartate/D-glutamate deacylase